MGGPLHWGHSMGDVLGYKWVTKNFGFVVNYVQISLIFRTTSRHDLVELRNLGRCRPVRSFCEGKITVLTTKCGYVNTLPAQKTSGARHAFGSNSSDLSNSLSRSRVGLRGPRALGHVFGKRFVVNGYE
jgi:hypothetical protein